VGRRPFSILPLLTFLLLLPCLVSCCESVLHLEDSRYPFLLLFRHRLPACVLPSRPRPSSDLPACTSNSWMIKRIVLQQVDPLSFPSCVVAGLSAARVGACRFNKRGERGAIGGGKEAVSDESKSGRSVEMMWTAIPPDDRREREII